MSRLLDSIYMLAIALLSVIWIIQGILTEGFEGDALLALGVILGGVFCIYAEVRK